MSRRLIIERALITLLLPLATLWLCQQPELQRLDNVLYDRMLPRIAHHRSDDIVIVAIDERSLHALGRWPWPRDVHAELLEGLAAARPRAVFFDIFLPESSAVAPRDARLADAMKLVPTYLPLLVAEQLQPQPRKRWPGFLPPLPEFAAVARGVGHASLNLDPDGVARTLYLEEGYPGYLQPYVGALLAQKARMPTLPVPPAPPGPDSQWQQKNPVRLLIAGPRGTYPTVPYISVLRGEVPPEFLRGKLVLIGATAPALGDGVATPNAGPSGELPGVEVHANAIDGLLHGQGVADLGPIAYLAWVVGPLWTALLLLMRAPRHALPIVVLGGAGCIGLSVVALLGRLWLPPAGPAVGLLGLYILWSWHSMEAQLTFLRVRAKSLDAVPAGGFELLPAMPPAAAAGSKSSPMHALDNAIARLQRLQDLTDEALHAMPVAVLICDDVGRISAANAAAARLLDESFVETTGRSALASLAGRLLPVVLRENTVVAPTPRPGAHWAESAQGEYVNPSGQVFRLEVEAFGGTDVATRGWVVMLTELTVEREAQRQREEWRSFLSHDLRSPQVTILSLLAMHEDSESVPPTLLQSIRREAERTLTLAEGFMDIAEAESDDYRFEPIHIATVLLDAHDQVWAYGEVSGVKIETHLSDADELYVRGDGTLLTRAIVNLLNNAIRHSPRGSRVRLCLAADEVNACVHISVADEGSGMTHAQLHALMTAQPHRPPPGSRRDADHKEFARSTGLGFAVVRAVV